MVGLREWARRIFQFYSFAPDAWLCRRQTACGLLISSERFILISWWCITQNRLRAVSHFFWSVEQNSRDTQMTTRVTEGARRERHSGCRPRFSRLAQRSRVCTPLTKSEEKERLLAVYTQTTQTRVVPLTGRATCRIRFKTFNQDTTQISALVTAINFQYDYTPDYSICFSNCSKGIRKKIVFLNSKVLYVIIQLSSTRCCLCHSLWVFYWYRLISQESAETVRQVLWTHARIAEPEHRTFCEKRGSARRAARTSR